MTTLLATLVLGLAPTAAPLLTLTRFPAPEAIQGVAVDKDCFYAVNNYAIGKYDKRSGKKLGEWKGEKGGPIIHLDSGLVVGDKLYCAHSNFPATPMLSSIEIWDTKTLKHIDSHSFGLEPGSATWIDWYDHSWWVAFANYSGQGGVPGRGNEYSTLVRYDKDFRRLAAYTYPAEAISRWEGMSNSGGVWGPNGILYCSPHHAPELYEMRLPKVGTVLELVRIIPVEAEGQGIALDKDVPGTMYFIQRRTREVLTAKIF